MKLPFIFYFFVSPFSPHPGVFLSPAPAPASLLTLSPSASGGLFLAWSPPAGHWENYRLFVFDGSQQVVSTSLDQEAVNFSIPSAGLTPGRVYRVVLRVESGGLTAESSCEGSTGQKYISTNTYDSTYHTCEVQL